MPKDQSGKVSVSKTALYAVIFILTSFIVRQALANQFNLANSLRDINSKAPIMVDEATRFDKAEAVSNDVAKLHYTLILWKKEDFGDNLAAAEADLRESLISEAKGNKDFDILRTHKITLVYSYVDKDAKPLIEITLKPGEY